MCVSVFWRSDFSGDGPRVRSVGGWVGCVGEPSVQRVGSGGFRPTGTPELKGPTSYTFSGL